jgi:hypothetical protein
LVKEGNRKFIGPRQFKGELSETDDANNREGGEAPDKYMRRGPGRKEIIFDRDWVYSPGEIRAFGTSRREMRKLKRLNKEGSSGRMRAMEILDRILNGEGEQLYHGRDGRKLPF